MAERWNEMSIAEKCEFLNTERQRMIEFVNGLAKEIARVRNQANSTASKLAEVAKAVEKLEAQVEALDGKIVT